MNYNLIQDVIQLVSEFERARISDERYTSDLHGFKSWVADEQNTKQQQMPTWTGIESGRSPESVISTLLVHLSRYAKNYSRSVLFNAEFSTQEDYIYLINLKAFGEMTKMALIKKNIQDKPVGMQIINRLVKNGWVSQQDSATDRRSKMISITDAGLHILEEQMQKIRQATQIVSADLLYEEKLELIRLLQKLEAFHHPIYVRNAPAEKLLDQAYQQLKSTTIIK
ncbi:MarR family winged helix-turn-helix transcriptional regulator [Sphingobacterium corticibacter]|uniref:MarR family transcriptional regulator n=1 Tax=Sphingobacterium corticibacter TaxID=2171749 RepID=A0A2T8HIQ2_9SPHI|nr:MarR family transcriptional regulator [Sphingobacterium corticibacter]PVH25273.1 MarR family transcriptional regulator [Sphingobacterium corticibacter]